MNELGQVVDIGLHVVVAFRRPFAVTVASEIRCDNMPILSQFLGDPVPASAMVTPAMHEKQRWRALIAPICVMQLEALRLIGVRSRSVTCHAPGYSRIAS